MIQKVSHAAIQVEILEILYEKPGNEWFNNPGNELVIYKKGALINYVKFPGKHLYPEADIGYVKSVN